MWASSGCWPTDEIHDLIECFEFIPLKHRQTGRKCPAQSATPHHSLPHSIRLKNPAEKPGFFNPAKLIAY
jgi:hypothetical protein